MFKQMLTDCHIKMLHRRLVHVVSETLTDLQILGLPDARAVIRGGEGEGWEYG